MPKYLLDYKIETSRTSEVVIRADSPAAARKKLRTSLKGHGTITINEVTEQSEEERKALEDKITDLIAEATTKGYVINGYNVNDGPTWVQVVTVNYKNMVA